MCHTRLVIDIFTNQTHWNSHRQNFSSVQSMYTEHQSMSAEQLCSMYVQYTRTRTPQSKAVLKSIYIRSFTTSSSLQSMYTEHEAVSVERLSSVHWAPSSCSSAINILMKLCLLCLFAKNACLSYRSGVLRERAIVGDLAWLVLFRRLCSWSLVSGESRYPSNTISESDPYLWRT